MNNPQQKTGAIPVSNVQQLYQLQQLDRKIDATNRRLKEIAANLVETNAYKSAKFAQDAAASALNICRAHTVDIDLEVKGLQRKIAKSEDRLYGGKLTNPKEAASLQEEIASTKRWLAKREEDLLETMIAQDDAETTFAARQAEFAGAEQQWETEQSALIAEKKSLEIALTALTVERGSFIPHIETADLTHYQKLRAKKGGVAVTGVDDGNCLSCGVMLPYRIVQQAEDDSTLRYCESCGRILFIL